MWHKERALWVPERKLYYGFPVPGVVASVGSGAAPPVGISVGTTGMLTHQNTNQASATFSGATIDGGGAALLAILVYVVAFPGSADYSGAPTTFTLNGTIYDTLLFSSIDDVGETGASKYVQAAAAIWDSPASGNIVFDPAGAITMTGSGCYFMNLAGLDASPLGVLDKDNITQDTTALAFTALTTQANSLLVAINGARTAGRGPFTFDDTNFTSLGESNGASGPDGNYDVGYQNGVPVDTYNCGGDWTNTEGDRLAGAAFELKAAA